MFGKNFRKLREGKGLTQAAMDEVFELTRGTVSNWENGYSWPEEELLEEIAAYFGVKVYMLTQREGNA